MHRQQAGRLVHGKVPIGSRFHMKVGDASVLFIKEIKLSRKICARYVQIRLFTPADYFHMHPSICSLESEPRPVILFDSPLDEAWFHCKEQATARSQDSGQRTGQTPQKQHDLGARRSPSSFRLRRNTGARSAITVQTSPSIWSRTNPYESSTYVPESLEGDLDLRVGISRSTKFFPRRGLIFRRFTRTWPARVEYSMPCGKPSSAKTFVLPTRARRHLSLRQYTCLLRGD